MKNVILSPSILACPLMQYGEAFQTIETCEQTWVHLDIMDGHFVPNLTFGAPLLEECKKYSNLKFDVHLMVNNPEFYVEAWKDYPIHNLTFHWEACRHHDRLIKKAKEYYPKVGVALNPSTPLHLIPDYLYHHLDLILLMSVNPGFYGQSFISGVLDKVGAVSTIIKSLGAKTVIQVDGGVTTKNIRDLVNRDASNLVVGSSFFKGTSSLDWKKNYNELLTNL